MWAIVEIMGHRVRAGLIGDASLGGATMLRVQHPTAVLEGEPLAEYYSPSAIFAIRPCTEAEAVRVAEYRWSTGPAPAELPATLEEFVDYDDDDDQDDERWSG
jgi:hypothetical protein